MKDQGDGENDQRPKKKCTQDINLAETACLIQGTHENDPESKDRK